MKTKILLFLVLVGFLVSPFKGRAQINVQDSLALVDLYNSTGGPGWINNTGWLTIAPVGTWHGVTTNAGRITLVDLSSNKLVGTIPSSLGNLSAANDIFFDNNQLKGNIPQSIGSLASLYTLRLQHNQLSGPVPASIMSLNSYTYVSLEYNSLTFSGLELYYPYVSPIKTYSPQTDIPLIIDGNTYSVAAGGKQSNNTYNWYKNDTLVATKFGDSTFAVKSSGAYSVQVTNSSVLNLTLYSIENANTRDSLAMVDLYNSTNGANWINNTNWLTPAPLATWYGITVRKKAVANIALSGNNLSGNIPASISTLINTASIDLSGNHLTGAVPADIGALASATTIDFSGNSLTGSIPMSIGSLTKITDFYLSGNHLTGNIPSSIGKMFNMHRLFLGGNNLTGNLPDSLQYLSNLTMLGLSNNQFSGNIPNFLGELSSLRLLDLSYNNYTGPISDSFGNLSNLQQLYITNNQLTDNIPVSFRQLSNLVELDLSSNHLSGPLPGFLGILPQLLNLKLAQNQFSGPIPDSICHSPHLGRLYLNGNRLIGSLDSLASTPNLSDFDLSDNLFSGSVPYFVYPFLSNFHIQNNRYNFSGMQNLPTNSKKYVFSLIYSPQRNIPYIKNGSQLSVSAGGILANDTFRLYKDGALLTTQTGDSVFTIQGLGRYNITVTNPVAPLLTLISDTLALLGDSTILPARPNTEYASYEYTDSAGWTHYYFNNNTPNDLTDDTLLLSLKKNGQNIGTIGDGTFGVKLVATAAAGSNAAVKLTNPLITNSSGYWVMNRYWQVTPTHKPTGSVGVRFYYNNQDLADVNGSYPAHNLTNNKLIFYKAIGGNPDPTTNLAGATAIISIMPGTAATDTTWTYHALSDTTQYGEYSVASFSGGGGGGTGNNLALPVVLVTFTGNLAKNDVQLNWQTAQEINAGYYTVERSLTGRDYTAIGRMNAAGNSTITQAYKLTDYNAALLGSTTLYYRLKITDKNGYATYSKVIAVNITGGVSGLLVYPNPAKNTATVIFYANAVGKYAIEVTDLEGRIIKRLESRSSVGINKVLVNVQGYSQGSYMVTVVGDNIKQQSVTLMKQ